MSLYLPDAVRGLLVAHAEAEAPLEACGLLGGPTLAQAVSVYQARNAARSRWRYVVHHEDALDALEQMHARGELLVGVYHSHTDSPAEPSRADYDIGYPGVPCVIVSLAGDVAAWDLGTGLRV